jgi:hypothetical protein
VTGYRKTVMREFTLPSGQRFLIRKINPLRIKELAEVKDPSDLEAAERAINAAIMAGVVEPKLRLEGLDIYIENEEEPLTYDDKMTLMTAINVWSGLTQEAMRRREKFCQERLGFHVASAGETLPQTSNRTAKARL